jgi:hypothetical protein
MGIIITTLFAVPEAPVGETHRGNTVELFCGLQQDNQNLHEGRLLSFKPLGRYTAKRKP